MGLRTTTWGSATAGCAGPTWRTLGTWSKTGERSGPGSPGPGLWSHLGPGLVPGLSAQWGDGISPALASGHRLLTTRVLDGAGREVASTESGTTVSREAESKRLGRGGRGPAASAGHGLKVPGSSVLGVWQAVKTLACSPEGFQRCHLPCRSDRVLSALESHPGSSLMETVPSRITPSPNIEENHPLGLCPQGGGSQGMGWETRGPLGSPF